MNYLALCQRLVLECGITGTLSTTVGATGEMARVTTWIDAAWTDIQNAHQDWDWMRTSASFVGVAAQAIYPLGAGAGTVGVLAANFNTWDCDTMRNYVTSVGTNSEIFMDCINYDAWRDTYQYGATRSTNSQPIQFAVSPAKALCLGPAPIAGYTFTIDYFTAPVSLALDADIPTMPTQWQMAIVYKAMMMYGAFEAATEAYQRGELEFGKLMARLRNDSLPDLTFAGAL